MLLFLSGGWTGQRGREGATLTDSGGNLAITRTNGREMKRVFLPARLPGCLGEREAPLDPSFLVVIDLRHFANKVWRRGDARARLVTND